jgi:peptide/nickel transport system substrate-binding protein
LKAGVGLATVGLLAAACGGSSSPKSTGTHGVQSAFNAAITQEVNPSEKKGGVLKLVATEDFDSLDPQRTYFGYSWNFRRLWDRQMFQFNPKPGKDSLSLVPDLATDKGQTSNGGKTFTYKIRTGVKFANGEAVTTKNIKYAIERLFAADVVNGGPTYLVDLLGGAKSYPGPYKDKAADHLGLTTILTPDDQTIVFNLTKPFSDMNYLLALPSSTPVPIDVDQATGTGGANYFKHPISSGPYKIDVYKPGKSLTLSRNANWDAKTDPVHKALPDSIEVAIGTDADTADKELLAGTADLVLDSPLQPTGRASVLSSKTGVGKYADNPLQAYTTYWLDIDKNVIPNIHCRNAIEYAVDKKSIQSVYGGPVVGGDIANTVIPPTSLSYEKDYNPFQGAADGTGDITKAKSELALCGKPNGFTTKIAHRKTGFGPKVFLSLQNSLKRAGIITTDVPTTRSADPTNSPTSVKSQGIGIINFGWGADFPTDYGFLEFVADPRQILPAGNSNKGEFDDPKASALIDKALTETGDAQTSTWKEFSHIYTESATAVPLLFPKQVEAHSPRLTNVHTLYAIFNDYDLMNVGVL